MLDPLYDSACLNSWACTSLEDNLLMLLVLADGNESMKHRGMLEGTGKGIGYKYHRVAAMIK